jgi:hypothetical protein
MSNNHCALGSVQRPNIRIQKQKLSIIEKKCPKCHHEKARDGMIKQKYSKYEYIHRWI